MSGDPVQLLEEVNKRLSFFSKKNDLDYNSEFNALILSDVDFNALLNVANLNFTSIYKPYLVVSNEEETFDDDDIPMIKTELALRGLGDDGSGNIEVVEVSAGITVYSPRIQN